VIPWKKVRAKMKGYMDNGARLGWINKPKNSRWKFIALIRMSKFSNLLQLCLEKACCRVCLELSNHVDKLKFFSVQSRYSPLDYGVTTYKKTFTLLSTSA